MPPLNEGDLMFMPIADPSISLDENTRIAQTAERRAAQALPEVAIRRRQGRPRRDVHRPGAAEHDRDDRAAEAARASGAPGMTLDALRAEMSRGGPAARRVTNIWTMPIINRIDMLTTGIRSEVGVKVFGTDLAALEGLARQVADVVRQRPRRQQRLSGAGDQRPVPEHRDRPAGRRTLRHRRRRHPGRDRDTPSARRR